MNYFTLTEPTERATQYLRENGYLLDNETGIESSFYPIFAAVLIYGSRVYRTHGPDSDYDFLVIVDSKSLTKVIAEEIGLHHVHDSNIEVSILSTDLFDVMCEMSTVRSLESIFTPSEFILFGEDWLVERRKRFQKKLETDRKCTLNRVRSAFSSVSSNSEVKARKKVQDSEYMIGLKSLFHSVRLLMFGLQIGKTDEIDNFEIGKECWEDINTRLVPKIDSGTLKPSDCKIFYKKWAKTPYLDEEDDDEKPRHLLTRFKAALPKI